MPSRIALVTYRELPALSDDDRLLGRALCALGLDVVPAIWNDPSVQWDGFDAAVVRSTWDYYLDLPVFLRWIAHLDSIGTPLLNSSDILRWNVDKRYLRELESRGIAVVPTKWVERGQSESLSELLDECGWTDAVVKPAVSASAWETWTTTRIKAESDEDRFRRLLHRGTVMVQPLLPEIARDGEWSLLYFGGEFSHAIVKRARPGDFRVQPRHGGTAMRSIPDPEIRARCDAVMLAALSVPARSLYARVDGTIANGRFLLMELELLEPSLFLGLAAGAAERLATVLVERLRPS